MRRPLVAVAGSLAVLFAVATAAFSLVNHDQRDGGFGYGMHQPVNGETRWRGQVRPAGPRQWMLGAAVTTEYEYLTEMLAHDEEAVAAATELRRSDRPQMRSIGQAIVASQTARIKQMKTWLAEWYPGQSTDVDYQHMMRDLRGLSGDRLDRVFLEDMIPHHMAAVMMSQQLLVQDVADHEESSTLAVSIRDDQHAEIFWMQRRLEAWFDVSRRDGMGPDWHWRPRTAMSIPSRRITAGLLCSRSIGLRQPDRRRSTSRTRHSLTEIHLARSSYATRSPGS